MLTSGPTASTASHVATTTSPTTRRTTSPARTQLAPRASGFAPRIANWSAKISHANHGVVATPTPNTADAIDRTIAPPIAHAMDGVRAQHAEAPEEEPSELDPVCGDPHAAILRGGASAVEGLL